MILTEKNLLRGHDRDSSPSERLKKHADTPKPINPRHEDDTTFPFLNLPGGIQNMVYKYCLVDAEYSIKLEARVNKRDGRRKPTLSPELQSQLTQLTGIVRRLYRVNSGPPDRDDLPTSPRRSLSKACSSFTLWHRFW
jgi:hypothetical protein